MDGRDGTARAGEGVVRVPRATYRLQFHPGFTFADAEAALPAIAGLGVSHVYASPVQMARPGSSHGYDVTDPSRINPELGGEEAFLRFCEALQRHGLGLVVDIVPNHMGIGPANPWWMSLLRHGLHSPDAAAFDIDIERPGAEGRLVLPALGDPYGEMLESGGILPVWDEAHGFVAVAHETPYPLDPATWDVILADAADRGGEAAPVLRSLSAAAQALHGEADEDRVRAGDTLARAVASALVEEAGARGAVAAALEAWRGRLGEPESFDRWHALLERQHWRLAHWRTAATDINYRRFFEVSELAGVRVERPEVFEATHAMILRHVREGRIVGLRIDHVDGLADPGAYLRRLREAAGPQAWIVVEKILEPGEDLPDWPVQGTTGYDALAWIDGLFVDREARGDMEAIHREAGGDPDFAEALRRIRRDTLDRGFASERDAIIVGLAALAARDRRTRDVTAGRLRTALADILACFPVYRTYRMAGPPAPADREAVAHALRTALATTEEADHAPHRFIASVLLAEERDEATRSLVRRFEQLTGPLMAKSLEDTLFYRWTPLIALNEVGGDPASFGLDPDEFHQRMAARAERWPHAMLATATHDTKRGEDVRARLLALAEDPQSWREAVARLDGFCREQGLAHAPDALDRSVLLQTLLGAWPMPLLHGNRAEDWRAFRERLSRAMTKSLREAKRRTGWLRPDEAYEAAMGRLVEAVASERSGMAEALRPLARRLARSGALNGLARTGLKLTLPGVPDIYQGTEFWDLSLVDPDNRRPVDYADRAEGLTVSRAWEDLTASWADGRIKQRLTRILLAERAASPLLFSRGGYSPLSAEGPAAAHVIAFARRNGGAERVTVAALRAGKMGCGSPDRLMPDQAVWDDTQLRLPVGPWRDVLTRRVVAGRDGLLAIRDAFETLPVAVLRKDV
jgi:(1->4)-alpha-D-glucan 1-alpha-D-glucosylmutase